MLKFHVEGVEKFLTYPSFFFLSQKPAILTGVCRFFVATVSESCINNFQFVDLQTWVGNKRRKLASKVDKNGVVALSNHAIVSAGVTLSPVLTTDMGAVRSVQRGPSAVHLLSPQASCSSSSSSSSSPSSNGSKNNNDVIVTGAYSLPRIVNRLESSYQSRTAAKVVPLYPNTESNLHSRHVMHPEVVSLQRKSPHIPNSSTFMFSQMRRMPQDMASVASSWVKQCGAPQDEQLTPTLNQQTVTNLRRTPPASTTESEVRIQQVFTIAGLAGASKRPSSEDHRIRKTCVHDLSETFSIAMETGHADDEYLREEELANMGVQSQLSKSTISNASGMENSRISTEEPSTVDSQAIYTVTARNLLELEHNSPTSVRFGEKGCQTSNAFLLDSGSCGSYPIRHFTESSPSRIPNLKV